ncbi:MAG: hypothetical protein IJE40_00030 [Clostridia bacterium]|nr:hypothetical protein [Clostridia bacterium]
MKKSVIKNSIISIALIIAMIASLALPALAAETTEFIKNFETEYGEIVSCYYFPTAADELAATIKSDSVAVYDYIYDYAYGITAEGLSGVKVWLCQYVEYANGEVLYRYYLDDSSNDFFSKSMTYQFISANDVIIEGQEPEIDTEVEETVEPEIDTEVEDTVEPEESPVVEVPEETVEPEEPTLTLDFLPEGLIANAEASGATATINSATVKLYKSLDCDAEAIEIAVEAGTQIDLITKYTFTSADGKTYVFYRYDYSGTNQELADAAISEYSGYVFIYADDITVTEKAVEEETTVEETKPTSNNTRKTKTKKGASRR